MTLSLGGAASQVGFSNDTQAEMFGQLIWDMFLGGSTFQVLTLSKLILHISRE